MLDTNKFPVLVLAPFLALLVSSGVQGRTIEVAFYEAGYLYSEETEKGIDHDVINELEERTDFQFKQTFKPRARIWYELEHGELEMSVSGIETEQRKQHSWFIPYIAQRNMALIDRSSAENYQEMEEFIADDEGTLAKVRAFHHGDFYDAMTAQLAEHRVIDVRDIRDLFVLLEHDRVNMILSLPVFYRFHVEQKELENDLVIRDWDEEKRPIVHHLIVSRAHFDEDEYRRLKQAIEEMREDGTLREIFARYLTEKEVEEALRF